MKTPLFRQDAMKKLGSSDELDRLMHVTNPKGWLALVTLTALVLIAALWGLFGSILVQLRGGEGILLHADARREVVTQNSGLVTEVRVHIGEEVREGQIVARLRTDDGRQVDVASLFSGTVDELLVQEGMLLDRGQQVAVVERGNEPLKAFIFVPAEEGKQLKEGMRAHVSPATVKAEEYGFMQGRVSNVSEFPVTEGQMFMLLENESLVDSLRGEEQQLLVEVELLPDPSAPSGFQWSSSQGPPNPVSHGTPVTATFVLGEERPANLVLPSGR